MGINALSRQNMLDNQVLTNNVTEPRLVEALASLPREKFVPAAYHPVAYADGDIPLPGNTGRVILEPMILARMIQSADVRPSDKVLVIGAERGYACAVLSKLAREVYAIEEDELLAAKANSTLKELGVHNVNITIGGLSDGYAQEKPYDVIFINGGAEELPEAITDQLRDGGRLVAVLSESGVGHVSVIRRSGVYHSYHSVCDTAPRVLPGFGKRPSFVF